MKKMFLMLAVLALASVVYAADVDISCNPDGDEVTVYYAGVNDANKPRGMAIRVDLDNGATITSVTPLENGYWVYPGSIDVEDPCQYNGTPVAEGGGVTDSYMIIEMGSLHSPTGYADGPTTTGQVIKFTVSGNCNVTTSGNAQRGGIVKYDATEADVTYTGCTVDISPPECLKDTAPDYANWVHHGKPSCWCFKRQCRGDIDGLKQGLFWVSLNDLVILRGSISKLEAQIPAGGYCADIDHAKQGLFWVSLNDLVILRQYISKLEAQVPCCDLDQNCVLAEADKFNFWTN